MKQINNHDEDSEDNENPYIDNKYINKIKKKDDSKD